MENKGERKGKEERSPYTFCMHLDTLESSLKIKVLGQSHSGKSVLFICSHMLCPLVFTHTLAYVMHTLLVSSHTLCIRYSYARIRYSYASIRYAYVTHTLAYVMHTLLIRLNTQRIR